LPGARVVAIAADDDRARAWILTDGGIGHYSARGEVFSELAAPPASLGIDFAALARDGAALAPGDGGAWIGSSKGLVFVTDKSGWLSTPITNPVRALLRDRAGWTWMATTAGLVARKPGNGELVRVGAADGCAIAQPRLLVPVGDRVLVIGADEQGRERIAIGKAQSWVTYRALPELAWEAATAHDGGVVVMSAGRLYRIAPAGASVRPLARDGIRLVPLASNAPSDWAIDPLDVALPQGAIALGSAGGALLVGTRDLGVARFRASDPHPRDWLRRKQMLQDATKLSVACARDNDCWIATGARQAWHWLGDRFVAGGPDVVLDVVRDPSGPIYGLHRGTQEKEIHLSRIDGPTWTQVPKIALVTPGDLPEISFARFATSGSLWVGLRYREGNEHRAYGIAIVEPASGKIAYHRAEAAKPTPSKKPKMLPIPVGVVGADVRGDIAWFATTEGVARLGYGEVKVWTEADGLISEVARAVTIAPDGGVFVATGAGAGVWKNKAWSFPPELRFEVNDVVATKNGQVWMATERGIAAWDGKKVRRVDTRRGLAENEIVDVVADQFDRVWARGPSSLTLIAQ
jgi:hypothetical protein